MKELIERLRNLCDDQREQFDEAAQPLIAALEVLMADNARLEQKWLDETGVNSIQFAEIETLKERLSGLEESYENALDDAKHYHDSYYEIKAENERLKSMGKDTELRLSQTQAELAKWQLAAEKNANALRAALKAQSEPVGEVIERLVCDGKFNEHRIEAEFCRKVDVGTKLYTTPQPGERDAERYRWLRDHGGEYPCFLCGYDALAQCSPNELDTAIDAAMKGK